MSARLAFCAAIRANGALANVTLTLSERDGWIKLAPLASGSEDMYDEAERACHDLNAILHAGFPLPALAAAAQSASNHAVIARAAAEAAAAAHNSCASFTRDIR